LGAGFHCALSLLNYLQSTEIFFGRVADGLVEGLEAELEDSWFVGGGDVAA
jgi:hypothetical protein